MNNILIVAIVIMIVCIVVNLIGLSYRINEVEEMKIELEKLKEDFDIIQNYINRY
jgi:hypothetical protein